MSLTPLLDVLVTDPIVADILTSLSAQAGNGSGDGSGDGSGNGSGNDSGNDLIWSAGS